MNKLGWFDLYVAFFEIKLLSVSDVLIPEEQT